MMFYGIDYDVKVSRVFPQTGLGIELAAGNGAMDERSVSNNMFKPLPDDYLAATATWLRKGVKFTHMISYSCFAISGLLISQELKDILEPNSFGIQFIPIDVYSHMDKKSPIPPEKRQYYMTHLHTPADDFLDIENTEKTIIGGLSGGYFTIVYPAFKNMPYDFFGLRQLVKESATAGGSFLVSEKVKAQIEKLDRVGIKFIEFHKQLQSQ